MNNLQERKAQKVLLIVSIMGVVFCLAILIPHIRAFIIGIAETVLGRGFDDDKWMGIISQYIGVGVLCFCLIILHLTINIDMEKHKKIFTLGTIGIVAVSIIVIITMQIRVRSLWGDEASFAYSIVTRNWNDLLVPPLDHMQSAPVLYVVFVKLFGSMFGYSEFSLRLFSFLAFVGLLFCTKIFVKNSLCYDNYKTAFVVAMSAILPTFVWYSNEFKPYISDAFFVVLTLLCYFYYTQGKIRLSVLSALCLVFFGFSTPLIFFIGGIFIYEFIVSIIDKNKKKVLLTFLFGMAILIVSVLYYFWWHSPVLEGMQGFWGSHAEGHHFIIRLLTLFRGMNDIDASFLLLLVPVALVGIISLTKTKNSVAGSVLLSLVLVFVASSMGFWPMTGRLWLFLPAVVLIFTPAGVDFIRGKVKQKKIIDLVSTSFFSAMVIYFSLNTLGFVGDRMYFWGQEINPLIHHVQNNIRDGEKVYVFPSARNAFKFRNGYTSGRIGDVTENNIIFGEDRNEWRMNSLGDELRSIVEHERVFLIFQLQYHVRVENGLQVLRNYGAVTEVKNFHGTPLYFFERHPK